jgi:hypothetical protein
MADQSISQLPVATTLTGDELTVVVQNGITKQTQVADIANAVAPGKFIDYLYFDGNSDLIVVYTDSTTQNLGPIPGYIAAEIAPNGHLILTNSTGGTTDAGSVFATLSQTFITANNESATLPNSQQLIAGANISLTSGANSITIAASGSAGSLNGAGTGIIVKDTSTTVVARTLTSTAGISITNPAGIAGNPVISPSLKLADIQNLATTGILAVVGGTTVVDRNIVGTNQQITVVGGDGSANPTISITSNPVLPGTGSVTLPQGNTAARPGALPGQIRFNTQLDVFEGQDNSGTWKTLALGGGVTSITLGTGLTGAPNPITSIGTISITATGVTAATYGSATQVPVFAVNAQGQITSVTNTTITASGLGAITAVNGTANEITTSQVGTVVTASLPSALTFTGKTVTGGTFNMTTATVGSDTVTTNTATQTLTGKTISGASNTLTNIGNSSLTNSSITLGTTNIALGGTSLTPAGLTSVTVTQDPVAALDLATKQYVDAVAQGLDPKASCVAATTVNITLSGTQTIDGVALIAGDRCLVKNQTTQANNGIYVVSASTWTRSLDMDVWAEVPGAFTFIEQGTTQADTGWVCTSNAGGTIGVTAITFVQFAGVGSYTAGTGLTLTGTQFSITNTAVTAAAYGSATQVGTFTVNAQGQLTLAGNTTVTPAVGSITGLGTGVATALAVNTGSAGAFVVNGGALGTPSSGTVTNLTGTASININGTVGATTASTGAFTYLSTSSSTNTTPVLAYNASNCNLALGATVANTYLQAVMQNKSGTAGASTNFAVSNDLGTDSTYYGEFGMNSSVFSASTPTDFFSLNNGIYFSGHDGDVTIGSGNGYKTYLAWGSAGQSAHVINASGAIGLNTNLGASPALSGTTNFGTAGQVLTSGGSGATPTWTTPPATGVTSFQTSLSGLTPSTSTTGAVTLAGTLGATSGGTSQSTYTTGDILYASASNTLSKLPIGSTGQILTIAAGVPSWGAAPASGVTSFSAGTTGLTPATATTGAVTLAGTLAIANGGTNGTAAPTAGGVPYGTGTAYAFTAAGTSGYVLTSNGAGAPTWAASAGATVTATSTNATFYPTFNSATSGSFTVANVNASYTYNPSTGNLSAPQHVSSNGLIVNATTVSTSYTIDTGTNAMSVGPITVASGATVTISSGQRWLVV